jgi:hypothetical protein
VVIPVITAARFLLATSKVGKKLSPTLKSYIRKKIRLARQDAKVKSHRTARYGDPNLLFRHHTRKTFGPKKKPMGKFQMKQFKADRQRIEDKMGITHSGPLTQSRFAYKHGFRTIEKRDPFSGRKVINKFEKATEPTSSVNLGGTKSRFGADKKMTEFVRNYRALEKMQRQTYKRNLNIQKVEKAKRAARAARAKYLNKPSNYTRGGGGK